MIPKIIHYCWFGKSKLPKLQVKCIESWKEHCPDYEIIEWNEDNFDISSNKYVYEAYNKKKWAFVSDYVRLYVLYHFGGIYMDTDTEVLKPIDIFLSNNSFFGFESEKFVFASPIGSIKYHPTLKSLLKYYNNRSFMKNDGSCDLTTIVVMITNHLMAKGLIPNNSFQIVNGITIYPTEYFCPIDSTGKLKITNNTYAIHHFVASWYPFLMRIKHEIFKKMPPNVVGLYHEIFNFLSQIHR
jgi:mannosyltransferase OCH1-like enzyme